MSISRYMLYSAVLLWSGTGGKGVAADLTRSGAKASSGALFKSSGALFNQKEKAEVSSQGLNDMDTDISAGKRKLPGLALHLATDRPRYEMGERIPITMRYTYTGDRKLKVEAMEYDRSGRIPEFTFRALSDRGKEAPDPAKPTSYFMGGMRTVPDLTSAQPHTQTVDLNEWVRFDTPGRYAVTLHSTAVQFNDAAHQKTLTPIPLDSDRLILEITPSNPAHRAERIEKARRALALPEEKGQQEAIRDLRFMVDRQAIPLLIQGMESPYVNVQNDASFGLRSFADMEPVRVALTEAMRDPKRSLSDHQAYWYASLLAEAQLRAGGRSIEADRTRFGELMEAGLNKFQQMIAAKTGQEPDLYVISYQGENVRRYSSTARDMGDIAVKIGKPKSVATDRDGNVYVALPEEHKVLRFSPDGTNRSEFVSRGIASPYVIAFSAKGDLYVASFDSIVRYAPDGKPLGVFANQGLNDVCGLAFDRHGNLYASNFNTGSIRKFGPGGADLGEFAKKGLVTPMGLAFDKDDNLYVADYNGRFIQKYALDGTDLGHFVSDHLGMPDSLAFDANGNLYVTDGGGVQKFSTQGRYLGQWAGAGLLFTNGLAFGSKRK